MAIKNSSRVKQYEKTVVEFATKDNGCFFAVSHDTTFLKTFRNTLNKELVIPMDRIRVMGEENHFISEIKTPYFKDKKILLLIERILNGRSTVSFIKQLDKLVTNVQIIALTSEVEKQILILLHEIGVSNFITKPISVNTLIEKIAFTIKPQGNIGQLIDQAKELLTNHKFDEAMSAAKKILKLKPNSAAGLMVLGDAYRATGKPDKAAESYEAAAESANLYLEPLKKLAELHKEQGNLEDQLAYLEKLDKLSPLNVERKIDMGDIHMQQGNSEIAEQYFSDAVKHATKEAQDLIDDVKRSIAERCIDKQPELAEKFFRSIIDSRRGGFAKSDIETFNRLGIALRRQGKWNKAVEEYDKALKVSPEDENLHFNKAVALMEGGKHVEAAKAADKAKEINPDFYAESIVLSFNLGVMYFNAKRYEDSGEFLKNTLKLDPKHDGAKKIIASLGKYMR